ncbi:MULTISPECIES: AraC family transcriptional regulator [Streptomyces]|uniref:AraC family transcriptional regulator n=1 Tax=Streptomyces lonegramiae TaxID=3075524 RepID=A0ABU2XNJ8_9ACTN|nr:AraC family transcriptional regulator [Streptomyces sp. DSM 41529]MDT0547091.1 AraC family transcriptional regulator [Streptomyces sp. DSM 41529]
MDPFDDLLRGVRADGAGFRRTELSPPWALRFTDAASLTLCVPLRGEGWISSERPGEGGEPRPVRVGDTAIVRGPGPYVLSDRSSSAGPAGRTVLLVGTYQVRSEVSRRLLAVLPPVLVMPGNDGCASLLDFLDAQVAACPPGQQVVLDRLLDWLLVCALREWSEQPEAVPPGWFRALDDEVIGPVLRAMHAAPDRQWTLAALVGEAGVSRTALAGRFAKLVGKPPLTYLTDWRMALAADLLTGSTATVAAVARQVGYADAFGFSAAFKRIHGVSPSEYRRTCRTDADCVGAECSQG